VYQVYFFLTDKQIKAKSMIETKRPDIDLEPLNPKLPHCNTGPDSSEQNLSDYR